MTTLIIQNVLMPLLCHQIHCIYHEMCEREKERELGHISSMTESNKKGLFNLYTSPIRDVFI